MKILASVLFGYVAFVALMELAIGLLQPDMDIGVVLTTHDERGEASRRKLAGVVFEGHLYVSSNHWLRGWYREALANPAVEVDVEGVPVPHVAVPVEGAERDRIAAVYRMGFLLRFICGFAPSRFLRLDPVAVGA